MLVETAMAWFVLAGDLLWQYIIGIKYGPRRAAHLVRNNPDYIRTQKRLRFMDKRVKRIETAVTNHITKMEGEMASMKTDLSKAMTMLEALPSEETLTSMYNGTMGAAGRDIGNAIGPELAEAKLQAECNAIYEALLPVMGEVEAKKRADQYYHLPVIAKKGAKKAIKKYTEEWF